MNLSVINRKFSRHKQVWTH